MYAIAPRSYRLPLKALSDHACLLRAEQATALSLALSVMFAAQDSNLTAEMGEGDVDGLAAQNAYLRDALEACRKQISELTQQVGQGTACVRVAGADMTQAAPLPASSRLIRCLADTWSAGEVLNTYMRQCRL